MDRKRVYRPWTDCHAVEKNPRQSKLKPYTPRPERQGRQLRKFNSNDNEFLKVFVTCMRIDLQGEGDYYNMYASNSVYTTYEFAADSYHFRLCINMLQSLNKL